MLQQELVEVKDHKRTHDPTLHTALESRALQKHDKYDVLAETHNARFFPLCMETYGTMHREYDNFITTLTSDVPRGLRSTLRSLLYIRAQQALMTGNARILRATHARLKNQSYTWWYASDSVLH